MYVYLNSNPESHSESILGMAQITSHYHPCMIHLPTMRINQIPTFNQANVGKYTICQICMDGMWIQQPSITIHHHPSSLPSLPAVNPQARYGCAAAALKGLGWIGRLPSTVDMEEFFQEKSRSLML